MDITSFLYRVDDLILNPIIILLFALSFIYFFYGIVKFLSTEGGDTGDKRIQARNSILWGIVGMIIMFSVYGIIKFILATFGIPPSEVSPIIPVR